MNQDDIFTKIIEDKNGYFFNRHHRQNYVERNKTNSLLERYVIHSENSSIIEAILLANLLSNAQPDRNGISAKNDN